MDVGTNLYNEENFNSSTNVYPDLPIDLKYQTDPTFAADKIKQELANALVNNHK